MILLLVGDMGKCFGSLKCLRVCMGQRLNLTSLKLRILRLLMNRKTCCKCTYKLVFVSRNGNQSWERIKLNKIKLE